MKMAQFAKFANNATNQVLGVTGLQLENLQSMFSYPDAINVTDPKLISGKVIYIEDGAPLYAKRASVFIEPFQSGSGDPSPSNVRAISGWDGANIKVCGNNIFDPTQIPDNARQSCTVNGNKFVLTVLSDGTYKSSTFEIEGNFEGYTLHLSGTVQNSGNNDGRISIRFYRGSSEISSSNRLEISAQTGFSVKQVPQGTTKLSIVCYSTFLNSATTGDKSTFTDVVLSLKNELYTPFVSYDYNITFPNEAGTVYGGVLDVTTGLLTVNRKAVDLGSLNYTRTSGGGIYVYTTTGMSDKAKGVTNIIADVLLTTNITSWGEIKPNNSICGSVSSTTVVIRADDYTNSSDLKTFLNGHIVVYELATPLIYQLNPTNILMLNGINTIFADCGSMEIEYYRRESGDNPYV